MDKPVEHPYQFYLVTREEFEEATIVLDKLRADNAKLQEALKKEGEMRNGNILFARLHAQESAVHSYQAALSNRDREIDTLHATAADKDARIATLTAELDEQKKGNLALVAELGRVAREREDFRRQWVEAGHDYGKLYRVYVDVVTDRDRAREEAKELRQSRRDVAHSLLGLLKPFADTWANDLRNNEQDWERRPDAERIILLGACPTNSDWRNAWQAVKLYGGSEWTR
jgi:hypothetical protein